MKMSPSNCQLLEYEYLAYNQNYDMGWGQDELEFNNWAIARVVELP